MSVADRLNELHAVMAPAPWSYRREGGDEWWFGSGDQVRIDDGEGEFVSVAGCDSDSEQARAEATVVLRNALPEIAAVIAAAEWVRDGWELYEAGGDEAHMTHAIENHLVKTLAALAALLDGTA